MSPEVSERSFEVAIEEGATIVRLGSCLIEGLT